MAKLFLTWGEKSCFPKLTSAEKAVLRKKLNERALAGNAFTISLNRAQLHWVKSNIGNGVIELISMSDNGTAWVAIGTDIEAATKAKIDAVRR